MKETSCRYPGWRVLWLVAVTLLLSGSVVSAKDLPPFAGPDAGGMPSNLRELRPNFNVEMAELLQSGTYWIWTARKMIDVRPELWDWTRNGPYQLDGGKRFAGHVGYGGGVVVNVFHSPRYSKLASDESVVQFFENRYPFWIGMIFDRIGGPRPGGCEEAFKRAKRLQVVETCGNYHWEGIWERQGDTDYFDAFWDTYKDGRLVVQHGVTDVIRFKDFDGKRILFFRQGVNGTYDGLMSDDCLTVVSGTASWYASGCTWSARIEYREPTPKPADEPPPAPRPSPSPQPSPSSQQTSPTPPPPGGCWRLVETRQHNTAKDDAEWMHKASVTEGLLSISDAVLDKDPDWAVSYSASFTPPPKQLVPGQEVTMDLSISQTSKRGDWGPNALVAAKFDAEHVGIGFDSSPVYFFDRNGKGAAKAGAGTGDYPSSGTFKAKVPKLGEVNSGDSKRIQLSVKLGGSAGFLYIYEWVK